MENDAIQIVGTITALNKYVSPIRRDIVFLQAKRKLIYREVSSTTNDYHGLQQRSHYQPATYNKI